MSNTDTISFTDIEEGFARVVLGRKSIGTVSRHKVGSTRTGTAWFARSSWYGAVGQHETREGAARKLAEAHLARRAV